MISVDPQPDDEAMRIFLDALERDRPARAAFVVEECRGDRALRSAVEGYLADHEDASWLDGTVDAAFPELSGRGGRTLAGFELVREVGRGAMGVVYLAYDEAVDRHVALKVVRLHAATGDADERRLLNEARAAGSLDHPGIAPVFGAGREEGVMFVVSAFIEGESLREKLDAASELYAGSDRPGLGQQHARSPGWVLGCIGWTIKLAHALEYAHRRGIVHRDVKPANVLIDERGEPRLVDFGIASLPDRPMETLVHGAGTLAYLSPERAGSKETEPSPASDVYALGAMLYECLTMRVPYEATTLPGLIESHARALPPRIRSMNPAVPARVEAVCFRALAPDPARRYASAAAFAGDLARAMAGEPIRGLDRFARPRRWVRRRRPVLIGALVSAAAATVTAVVALHDPPPTGTLSLTGPAGERFSLHRIDPVYRTPGTSLRSGTLPSRGSVPSGTYRVLIKGEYGVTELTRRVGPGERLAVRPPSTQTEWSPEGMLYISSGTAVVGRGDVPGSGFERREVELPAYWIDAAEVSNAEYRAYVRATGAPPPPVWPTPYDERLDDLPVVGVTVDEARAYAEWAGKRLPTDVEWERAAAGAEGRVYPWGAAPPPERPAPAPRPDFFRLAPGSEEGRAAYLAGAEPVGETEYDRTPEGGLHFFGNVAEWTESVRRFSELPGDRKGHELEPGPRHRAPRGQLRAPTGGPEDPSRLPVRAHGVALSPRGPRIV